MKQLILFSWIYVIFGFQIIQAATNDKFVVVIDAGHGGKDSGAIRGNKKEKDINLEVALALGKLIEANMKDVKIVYTRKTDVFIDLYKRSNIANKAKANLFISIHTNSTAAKTTNASGADTYILGLARSNENLEVAKRENSVIMLEDNYNKRYEGFDPNSPESNILFEFMTNKYMEQSLEFATFIQKEFSSVAKRIDRGVAQAGFLVLRESGMPSVLIELGFINNPNDAEFLISTNGQQKMASAIYYGFKRYKEEFDKRQGTRAKENIKNSSTSASISTTKTEKNTTNDNDNQIGTEYRVQILTTPKKLSSNSKEFKGLSPIDFYYDNGTYKYTYSSSKTQAEALKILRIVREKFNDAFVIKFENGIRIK